MRRRALPGAAVSGLVLDLVALRPVAAADLVNITIAVSSNTLTYGCLKAVEDLDPAAVIVVPEN